MASDSEKTTILREFRKHIASRSAFIDNASRRSIKYRSSCSHLWIFHSCSCRHPGISEKAHLVCLRIQLFFLHFLVNLMMIGQIYGIYSQCILKMADGAIIDLAILYIFVDFHWFIKPRKLPENMMWIGLVYIAI